MGEKNEKATSDPRLRIAMWEGGAEEIVLSEETWKVFLVCSQYRINHGSGPDANEFSKIFYMIDKTPRKRTGRRG